MRPVLLEYKKIVDSLRNNDKSLLLEVDTVKWGSYSEYYYKALMKGVYNHDHEMRNISEFSGDVIETTLDCAGWRIDKNKCQTLNSLGDYIATTFMPKIDILYWDMDSDAFNLLKKETDEFWHETVDNFVIHCRGSFTNYLEIRNYLDNILGYDIEVIEGYLIIASKPKQR